MYRALGALYLADADGMFVQWVHPPDCHHQLYPGHLLDLDGDGFDELMYESTGEGAIEELLVKVHAESTPLRSIGRASH